MAHSQTQSRRGHEWYVSQSREIEDAVNQFKLSGQYWKKMSVPPFKYTITTTSSFFENLNYFTQLKQILLRFDERLRVVLHGDVSKRHRAGQILIAA
jgi:hypothetical protein